ncbi:DNA-binding response regulator [Streptococcus pneumoniae]|nr:DNA-binding response regulator [Streptococcus pneumoniae]
MHKILLIEDDQVIRQQVGKMLSEWGFEVVLVEDFMEVLSLFVQSEPHLVLMDIGLPLFNPKSFIPLSTRCNLQNP